MGNILPFNPFLTKKDPEVSESDNKKVVLINKSNEK